MLCWHKTATSKNDAQNQYRFQGLKNSLLNSKKKVSVQYQ